MKNKKAIIITCSHENLVYTYWYETLKHKGYNMSNIPMISIGGLKSKSKNSWVVYEKEILQETFELVVVQWHEEMGEKPVNFSFLHSIKELMANTLNSGGVVVNIFESCKSLEIGSKINNCLVGVSPATYAERNGKCYVPLLNDKNDKYLFKSSDTETIQPDSFVEQLNNRRIRGYSVLKPVDDHVLTHVISPFNRKNESTNYPILLSKNINNGLSIALAFAFCGGWNHSRAGMEEFQDILEIFVSK